MCHRPADAADDWARGAALALSEQAGAETTFIDLHDYNMPLYSKDLHGEQGMPSGVIEFKEMLKSHNGFLIASPEYNGSLTGTLKNAIDWATIKAEGEEEWRAGMEKLQVLYQLPLALLVVFVVYTTSVRFLQALEHLYYRTTLLLAIAQPICRTIYKLQTKNCSTK
mgnify:CR=1 FL=1